ncbi:MAG: xanthine dehydrogenase family protein molybdopterin-binding subunit, partial [Candidatus Tectomicrobia bacterium]|nr:xanthine dehydrogenase family protein molybdopterin-binding subunit [Candidatus Tectomicrobia bacterium]
SQEDLEISDGRVAVKGTSNRSLSFGEVLSRAFGYGGSISVTGISRSEASLDRETGQGKGSTYYFTGAGGCEAEIDLETGAVRVLRYVAAHNVGKAINPTLCAAQIEGGVASGVSMTLFEEMRWDNGQLLNPNLVDYRLLSICEAPPVQAILIEVPHREGPFGAIGAGEPAIVPTSAAIGNAVARALNVRLFSLPLTPDKVLTVLLHPDEAKQGLGSARTLA